MLHVDILFFVITCWKQKKKKTQTKNKDKQKIKKILSFSFHLTDKGITKNVV